MKAALQVGDIVYLDNGSSENMLKRKYKILSIRNDFANLQWIDCPMNQPQSKFYFEEITLLKKVEGGEG